MLQRFFPKLQKKDLMLHGIVLLGLLGMGCILLSSVLPSGTAAKEETGQTAAAQEEYRRTLGRVEVLVTLDGSEEYQYATQGDRTVSEEQVRSSTTYVTVGGSRDALVESVSHPGITGVVVACEGGADSTVQEAVYRAVSVACGLPSNCIFVTRSDPSAIRKESTP